MKGVDISTWQKITDYEPFRGFDFAILKLFEGIYKDSRFESHYEGLQGVPKGVYVFSHASSVDSAKREAEAALWLLDNRPLELPVFLDMEASDINFAYNSPTTDWALAFGEVIKAGGYQWGVYASESWWKHKLDVEAIRNAGGVVWVAKYSSQPPELYFDIWQHTSKGYIDGYDENLDLNVTKDEVKMCKATLSYGAKSAEVKELQILLGKAGYDCGGADGDFGSKTKNAVIQFQKANGLTADGVVGAATWAKLEEKKEVEMPEISSYDTNKALQAMLTRVGYPCGVCDGVVGGNTNAAVAAFNKDFDTNDTMGKLKELCGVTDIPVALANIPYHIFTPINVKYGMPLIVYLHGDGAVGRPADLLACGILKQAKAIYGDNFPFVLVCPCTPAYSWISEIITPTLKGVIDFVAKLYKSSEVIITGHSRGGIGTWNAVDRYPGYFKRAVPVSGMGIGIEAQHFKGTEVRAFVGGGDSDYPVYGEAMRLNVLSLNAFNVPATLTVLDGMEHGSMSSAPYTKELFDWMVGETPQENPQEPPHDAADDATDDTTEEQEARQNVIDYINHIIGHLEKLRDALFEIK